MRKIVTITVIMLITGGAVLGWLFLENQPASTPNTKTTQSVVENEPVNPEEHNYTDIDFAKKMIVHDQQGIQMAEIAQANSENEEVRQMAASISEALSNDTKQYINWLNEWSEKYFSLSDFPQMEGHDMYPTHPGMASLRDLRSLESASGSSVDELFLRLMIAHHEGAAEMANSTASERMQFGQMISLKNETLKNQAEEIQKMKQLQTKGE